MGDIGTERREVEFEPVPETLPGTAAPAAPAPPSPAPAEPARTPG